ncbi:MAG: hypothetical protein AB9M53_01145 [Leptothrix sp. (in: b-proteobacteria)]
MLILFLKARSRHDTHTGDLFDAIVQVHGYTKEDGTFVRPHAASRKHAIPDLPVVDVAKMSNNGPVKDEGAKVEATIDIAQKPTVDIAPADGPNPLGLPNERTVAEHLLPRIEVLVEKANKRAAKLGVEGFKLTKGDPYPQERKTDDGQKYTTMMVPLKIEGPVIKATGGWSLLGRVDIEDEGNIVNTRPGATMPVRYRDATGACEHCNAQRDRKSIFVFEDADGAHKQVGRSCLQDFMGRDPAGVLWAANEFGGLMDDIDAEMDSDPGVPRDKQLVSLDEVMTAAAHAVAKFGFTSTKAAMDKSGMSTRDDVSGLLFDRKIRETYKPTDDDRAKAKAVIDWVQSEWGGKPDQSDYEYNAVNLTARRHVEPKRLGVLVSLISAYDRAQSERVARDAAVNAHVGEVGQKREFSAVFAGVNWFETQWGSMAVARFQTPEGLVVYKGSTQFWPDGLKAGDAVRFTGTIKSHEDYKGTKQTIVQRCKVLTDGEPAEKPKSGKAKPAAAEPVVAPAPEPKAEHVPTYVHRPVTNAAALHAWAVKAGFKNVTPPDQMHVTVAYSKTPVDRSGVPASSALRVGSKGTGQKRTIGQLGSDGALVLHIGHPELDERHRKWHDGTGASWDFKHTRPAYKPHVTISYGPQDIDHTKVEPFDGLLELGPEQVEDLKPGWRPVTKSLRVLFES